jgi:hypothetical protein
MEKSVAASFDWYHQQLAEPGDKRRGNWSSFTACFANIRVQCTHTYVSGSYLSTYTVGQLPK